LDIYFNEFFFNQYESTREGMEKLFQECLSDSTQKFIVICEGNLIQGFALYDNKGGFSRSGYLRLIVIRENMRNKKLGESLIKFLENDCKNSKGFFLLVTSTNLKAQNFYFKLGYQKIGEIPNYVKLGITENIYFKKN
jgi:ribosomal protein S18 acetylase RimI-like enzyme